jgi:hypothetical protein
LPKRIAEEFSRSHVRGAPQKKWLIKAALPFPALSLSRYVLDEARLAGAAKNGCTVQRGVFVEKLTPHENSWMHSFVVTG